MNFDLLRSRKLEKSDLVRLVSPASYPPKSDINYYIHLLEGWGLRCDTGNHILDEFGYMAGSDIDRLDDLNSAFKNPEVRAIITTRGGAGAYRIADDIDFSSVRADPKPLIGFSDITNLHLSLLKHCQLGSIHGCLWGRKAQRSIKQLLMSTAPITLHSDSEAVSAGVKFSGTAQGRLIGGNLQGLASAIGVRMPPMKGAILLIEYHRATGLGTADRYLTQLLRSGVLEGIVGVAVGSFEGFRDYTDRGWNIVDVLNDRLGSLNVPVLGGIYAGHDLRDENGDTDQYAIPLGAHAILNVYEGSLTVESILN